MRGMVGQNEAKRAGSRRRCWRSLLLFRLLIPSGYMIAPDQAGGRA